MPKQTNEPARAVLVPAYNEAPTIAKVVGDFRRELPGAEIYVFDNCSTDETATIAAEHGAIVRKEPRRGKGLSSMVCLTGFTLMPTSWWMAMIHTPRKVHALLEPVLNGDADMTVGVRLHSLNWRLLEMHSVPSRKQYRRSHKSEY